MSEKTGSKNYQWKFDREKLLINRKLAGFIRCSVRRVLFDKSGTSSKELNGCSTTDLKTHIESKFLPGMTWESYGE